MSLQSVIQCFLLLERNDGYIATLPARSESEERERMRVSRLVGDFNLRCVPT